MTFNLSPLETQSAFGYDSIVPGGEELGVKNWTKTDIKPSLPIPNPDLETSIGHLQPIIPRSRKMLTPTEEILLRLEKARTTSKQAFNELEEAFKVVNQREEWYSLDLRATINLARQVYESCDAKIKVLHRESPDQIREWEIASHKLSAAAELGRKGGLANKGKTSEAKTRTARENAMKGGRKRKPENYCSVCERPLTASQKKKGFKTCDADLPEDEQVCERFERGIEANNQLMRQLNPGR